MDDSGGYEFKQIAEWNEEDVACWMAGTNIHAHSHLVTLVASLRDVCVVNYSLSASLLLGIS